MTGTDEIRRPAAGEPDPELFEAGATIVTANRRLARRLQRLWAERARRAGETVWDTPDILPWGAWLQRCWETLLLQAVGTDAAMPAMLLGDAQAQALWEQIIADSAAGRGLLRVAATAREAREAWQMQCAWRLRLSGRSFAYGRDVGAWMEWSARYRERCAREGWIDEAQLPDLIAETIACGILAPPAALCLAGFDEFTPQQHALIDALEAAGARVKIAAPPASAGRLARIPLQDAESEIIAAARWARARLEAGPDARIGIVVPDLAERRAQVMRIFDDVLYPGGVLPSAAARAPLYNLSAGAALADCPLIHDALLALKLAGGDVTLAEAGALLRSPFFAGAEHEFAARALHDVRLREHGDGRVALATLVTHSCPLLAAALARVETAVADLRDTRLRPSDWAERMLGLLGMLGWPGERTLDSDEYQAVEAWRELVSGMAALDAVQPAITFRQALAQVRRLSAERMFQPQRPDTPIQILGLLESAGLVFDHLWILGLHDGAWPPAPQPNPFLPIALQRELGMPRCSPEREYAVAERITARLLAAASEVRVSHPLHDGDRELRPSPLIAALPASVRPPPDAADEEFYGARIHTAARIEVFEDTRGPALASGQARGGSQLFKHQSDCPFRAFTRLRLHAQPLKEAAIGLEASERGILLHRVVEALWKALGSQATLRALDQAALDTLLGRCVDAALERAAAERPQVFTPRFRALERERLLRSLGQWLDFEEARGPFTVEATEHRDTVTAGGVTVEVKIDRIDRLADGRLAIIDYKTGDVHRRQWFGERPEDPQLPLYTLSIGDALGAVLFARIRTGESDWVGVARGDDVTPKIKAFDGTRDAEAVGGWDGLLAHWRAVLTRLGEEFRDGHAAVDPRDAGACDYCGLTPLCRINEQTSPVADEARAPDQEPEP
jgi:ATP-dependent helicase/nuclease subunit B